MVNCQASLTFRVCQKKYSRKGQDPVFPDFIVALQYLKGAYKKDGDKLLSRVNCGRARGRGFKLNEGRFR